MPSLCAVNIVSILAIPCDNRMELQRRFLLFLHSVHYSTSRHNSISNTTQLKQQHSGYKSKLIPQHRAIKFISVWRSFDLSLIWHLIEDDCINALRLDFVYFHFAEIPKSFCPILIKIGNWSERFFALMVWFRAEPSQNHSRNVSAMRDESVFVYYRYESTFGHFTTIHLWWCIGHKLWLTTHKNLDKHILCVL